MPKQRPTLGLRPRTDRKSEVVSPYFWYHFGEGTGTTLADVSGSGPTLTVEGTLTNFWDNPGFGTGNGTDIHTTESGEDAHIRSVCDLQQFGASDQLLIAFDIYVTANPSSQEDLLWWGENAAASGWGIEVNASGQFVFVIRAVDASGANNGAISGYTVDTNANARQTIVLDVQGVGDNLVDIDLYVNGTAEGTSVSSHNLAGGTGAIDAPTDNDARGLTLMARNTGASQDRWWGGRMGNAFVMHRSSIDTTLAALLGTELFKYQSEFPLCLVGK